MHRSELCNSRQHPSDVLAVGDIIEAQIISVDVKRNRIGLSVKHYNQKNQIITIMTVTEIMVNVETTIVIITVIMIVNNSGRQNNNRNGGNRNNGDRRNR